MKNFLFTKTTRNIVLVWLCWVLVLVGFQALVRARFDVTRPDTILRWTPYDTYAEKLDNRTYLNDPFMNNQVAWDSEFYLSIATYGYDDPLVRTVSGENSGDYSLILHDPASMNYAFFPFYPLLMRVVRVPFLLLNLTPIATSTLAGVLVSVLGALGAMLALYDLTRDELGEAGGFRTAFYLLAFPTGFFLAMVHTEGLFVGLAFGSLALLRRKQWLWAAILAACATWTRAVGICIFLPLAWALFQELRANKFSFRPFPWRTIFHAVLALAPLGAYLVWRLTLGGNFDFVEAAFFGRGALQPSSLTGWAEAVKVIWQGKDYIPNYQAGWDFPDGVTLINRLNYVFEILATLVGVIACIFTLRKNPGLSLFGLGVILISFMSGNAYGPQGMPRYVLTVPSVFLMLGSFGKSETFDRIWTIASILLMGLFATMFAFNFWVA